MSKARFLGLKPRKINLSSVLPALIIVAFLFHTVLEYIDKLYRLLGELVSRKMFFDDIRALTVICVLRAGNKCLSYATRG